MVMFLFASCKKNNHVLIAEVNKQQEKIACDFGITNFNYTKRVQVEEKKGRGNPHNPPVVNPPTTSGTWLVLLDFDGRDIQNTAWGVLNPGTVAGSGLYSNQIAEIIINAQADFPGLKIAFTTDENYFNSHTGKKQVVVCTEDYEFYGRVGGVAFINSFVNQTGSPALVFSSLLNYSTKNVSEAISHELGHTLGLYHRVKRDSYCTITEQYDSGYFDTELGYWVCTIMGVSYHGVAKFDTGTTATSCPVFNQWEYLKNLIGLK